MAEHVELSLGYLRRHPESAAVVLEKLSNDTAAAYLAGVPPALAAPVLSAMLPFRAARCLQSAGESFARGVLPDMTAAAATAVLRRLPAREADALVAALPARVAFRLRLLLRYPVTTVGAWMEPSTVVLPADSTVGEAWTLLRREGEALDRRLYLLDREQLLLGEVDSGELLRATDEMPLERLVRPVRSALSARADLSGIIDQPAWREQDPRPVVARDGRFLGTARYAVLRHAETTRYTRQPRSILAETLMDPMDTYWAGLSRLIEAPFPRRYRRPSDKE